jgi:drug/metabolite transporter (DMT)-like permease
MSSVSLYIACVLIWGSTWLAITFQLGQVPPAVSVAYRFALASVMLLAYCVVRRLPMRYTLRDHAWIALQGLLLFGANYVLVYLSEGHVSSGLTAVIFSSMAFWNILGMRYFYATPLRPAALIGAALGILGVAIVFAPELTLFSKDRSGMLGLGYGLAATLAASLGNITAARNQRHGLPVVQQNAFGMLYGALLVTLFALLTGERFVFENTMSYTLSLLYLALFGSVLAFGAYLTLLGRIGADRAGYITVAIPIVAVLLSTLFEGFRWQPATVLGITLCVLGNVLVLRKKKPQAD